MDRNEVVSIFKIIHAYYPNFSVNSEKVDVWHKVMEDMDYKRVKKRLEDYAIDSPFPPTVANISAYAPPVNETLALREKWKKESEAVPQATKDEFARKFEALARKLGKND